MDRRYTYTYIIFFLLIIVSSIFSCHKKNSLQSADTREITSNSKASLNSKDIQSIDNKDESSQDLPFRPYANGLTELKTHNYSDAKRWFSITISDFPNSEFAKMAKVMNSVILLAEELGNLRCLKFWNEKNESLKASGETGSLLQQAIERDMVAFEQKAQMLGKELVHSSTLVDIKDLTVEKFDLSLSLEEKYVSDLDNTQFIELLRNATNYEQINAGKDEFIREQTIKNFLSFSTEFFKVTLMKGTVNLIEAPADYLVFLNALGTRLYYISESSAQDENQRVEYIDASKRILLMAKTISENDKYNAQRLKIIDLLNRIEKESQ